MADGDKLHFKTGNLWVKNHTEAARQTHFNRFICTEWYADVNKIVNIFGSFVVVMMKTVDIDLKCNPV